MARIARNLAIDKLRSGQFKRGEKTEGLPDYVDNDARFSESTETTDLPQPPTDKQYQLWAIVNDQPVDLGVFDLDSTRTGILQLEQGQPQAFAITLEPRGGSAQPTLDQMYVSGGV